MPLIKLLIFLILVFWIFIIFNLYSNLTIIIQLYTNSILNTYYMKNHNSALKVREIHPCYTYYTQLGHWTLIVIIGLNTSNINEMCIAILWLYYFGIIYVYIFTSVKQYNIINMYTRLWWYCICIKIHKIWYHMST